MDDRWWNKKNVAVGLVVAFIIAVIMIVLYYVGLFDSGKGEEKKEQIIPFGSIGEPIDVIKILPRDPDKTGNIAVSEIFVVDNLGRFLDRDEMTNIPELIDSYGLSILSDDNFNIDYGRGVGLKIKRPTPLSRIIIMFGPVAAEMGQTIRPVIPMILVVNTTSGKKAMVEFDLPTAKGTYMFDSYLNGKSDIKTVVDGEGNLNKNVSTIYVQTYLMCNREKPHAIVDTPKIELIDASDGVVSYSMTSNIDLDSEEVAGDVDYNSLIGCYNNYILKIDKPVELKYINIEFYKGGELYNVPYKLFVINELGQLILSARSLNSVNKQVEIRRHLSLKS